VEVENRREHEIFVTQQAQHRARRLSMEQALALNGTTPMYVSRERPELLGARSPMLPPLLARKRDERRAEKRRAS
jgi:hypothetical protein